MIILIIHISQINIITNKSGKEYIQYSINLSEKISGTFGVSSQYANQTIGTLLKMYVGPTPIDMSLTETNREDETTSVIHTNYRLDENDETSLMDKELQLMWVENIILDFLILMMCLVLRKGQILIVYTLIQTNIVTENIIISPMISSMKVKFPYQSEPKYD